MPIYDPQLDLYVYKNIKDEAITAYPVYNKTANNIIIENKSIKPKVTSSNKSF